LATVLPISLLLLAACGGSAKEQARKLHQTEESWKATTRLTTELWKQGAIPAEYARQTLEAAAQGLAEARASAAKLSQ
jgi:outer membrane biogenesis lipoprotein LolB